MRKRSQRAAPAWVANFAGVASLAPDASVDARSWLHVHMPTPGASPTASPGTSPRAVPFDASSNARPAVTTARSPEPRPAAEASADHPPAPPPHAQPPPHDCKPAVSSALARLRRVTAPSELDAGPDRPGKAPIFVSEPDATAQQQQLARAADCCAQPSTSGALGDAMRSAVASCRSTESDQRLLRGARHDQVTAGVLQADEQPADGARHAARKATDGGARALAFAEAAPRQDCPQPAFAHDLQLLEYRRKHHQRCCAAASDAERGGDECEAACDAGCFGGVVAARRRRDGWRRDAQPREGAAVRPAAAAVRTPTRRICDVQRDCALATAAARNDAGCGELGGAPESDGLHDPVSARAVDGGAADSGARHGDWDERFAGPSTPESGTQSHADSQGRRRRQRRLWSVNGAAAQELHAGELDSAGAARAGRARWRLDDASGRPSTQREVTPASAPVDPEAPFDAYSGGFHFPRAQALYRAQPSFQRRMQRMEDALDLSAMSTDVGSVSAEIDALLESRDGTGCTGRSHGRSDAGGQEQPVQLSPRGQQALPACQLRRHHHPAAGRPLGGGAGDETTLPGHRAHQNARECAGDSAPPAAAAAAGAPGADVEWSRRMQEVRQRLAAVRQSAAHLGRDPHLHGADRSDPGRGALDTLRPAAMPRGGQSQTWHGAEGSQHGGAHGEHRTSWPEPTSPSALQRDASRRDDGERRGRAEERRWADARVETAHGPLDDLEHRGAFEGVGLAELLAQAPRRRPGMTDGGRREPPAFVDHLPPAAWYWDGDPSPPPPPPRTRRALENAAAFDGLSLADVLARPLPPPSTREPAGAGGGGGPPPGGDPDPTPPRRPRRGSVRADGWAGSLAEVLATSGRGAAVRGTSMARRTSGVGAASLRGESEAGGAPAAHQASGGPAHATRQMQVLNRHVRGHALRVMPPEGRAAVAILQRFCYCAATFDAHRKRSGGGAGSEAHECSVCLEPFKRNQVLRRFQGCGHCFHERCISEWMAHGSVKCPMCRWDPIKQGW